MNSLKNFPTGPLQRFRQADLRPVDKLFEGVQDAKANPEKLHDIQVPWNPINRTGGYREVTLDLATSGILHRFNGRAWGVVYLYENSNLGGRLDLDFLGGGRVTNVAPGTMLPVPFDQLEISRASRSATTGSARLVILTHPNAEYVQPIETPPANVGGVYLLGSSSAFSALQGEGSLPPTRSLNFDAQTGNFTVGLTVTGGTSAATGVIASQDDAGATGTLYLSNVSGTFQDNEAITDTSTGAATADGADAALAGASVPTSFDVAGWKRITVLIDSNSASANATSFDLVPHFFDSDVSAWMDQTLDTISIPDSSTTAQRYRSLSIALTGLRGRLFFQIANLLAAARTGLSFKVLGVE